MAKGDLVGTIVAVSATTTAVYVPSGTTQILIRTLFGRSVLSQYVLGTSSAQPVIAFGTQTFGPITVGCYLRVGVPLTMVNDSTSAIIMGFSGIETR